jgi:hypothetical protein
LGLPGETIKVENGLVFIKPKNADTFQQINQIDDGIFIDDQHQKQIQQLIENNYKILNLTNNGPLDSRLNILIPMISIFSWVIIEITHLIAES